MAALCGLSSDWLPPTGALQSPPYAAGKDFLNQIEVCFVLSSMLRFILNVVVVVVGTMDYIPWGSGIFLVQCMESLQGGALRYTYPLN